MQSFDSQGDCLKCPACDAGNFDFALFCVSCGISLDEEGAANNRVADLPSFTPVTKSSRGLGFIWSQWEAFIGILVLISVTGYVLYDWQHSNAQSEAYRNGLVATEHRDWDNALASFQRAGDYLTSEQREEEARKKVAERDQLYFEGLKAKAREDWRSSIAPLQRLQEVQPAYRDSAALLAQAKSNVLNDGLAGIVYLVDGGPAPGLYIRDAKGQSTLLPGSDKYSVVRAISPEGTAIVYDRPGEEKDYLDPSWNHNPFSPHQFGPDKYDRVLVLAQLDQVIRTMPLPQLDRDGKGIFSEEGLWWYSSQPSNGIFGYEVFYWSRYLPSGPGVVRVSDLANDKLVVAVDAPRSRVVLAQATGDARTGEMETRLYLAEATGENPQLLYTAQGEVYQATMSRDGRWLLFLTQRDTGNYMESIASTLPLDAPRSPTGNGSELSGNQERIRTLRSLWRNDAERHSRLSASFVPSDTGHERKRGAKVLVNHVEYGIEHMLVHDLDSDTVEVLWREGSDASYQRDFSTFSHNGEYLASRRPRGDVPIITVSGLSPNAQGWVSATLPASDNQIVRTQFAPLDDYLIVSIHNPDGMNRGYTQKVYSLNRDEERTPIEPRLIAVAERPTGTDTPTIALPANGSMLAYVNASGELRAVFYDGSHDTLVATNVSAVWSLKGRRDLYWWR